MNTGPSMSSMMQSNKNFLITDINDCALQSSRNFINARKSSEPIFDRNVVGSYGNCNAIMKSTAEMSQYMARSSFASFQVPGHSNAEMSELTSIELRPAVTIPESFSVMTGDEHLEIPSANMFLTKCGCETDTNVKVVAIFGKTGEGKSHTLNQLLFKSQEIFHTSPSSSACTQGIWAAYEPDLNIICLDTEGLCRAGFKQNQRMRMLLKVFAISDIVIYQTRSERLHSDVLKFLAEASRAHEQFFIPELKFLMQKRQVDISRVFNRPFVIIHHETQNTEIIHSNSYKSAEEKICDMLDSMKLNFDAFRGFKYIGTKSENATNFKKLRAELHLQVNQTCFARKLSVVYQMLDLLNQRFSTPISEDGHLSPDEYLSCPCKCLSCKIQCQSRINHELEGVSHHSSALCIYQECFDNHIYRCKKCLSKGKERIVVPKTCSSSDSTLTGLLKYAMSGTVLECFDCGVIYRSRQNWLYNEVPLDTVVETEIVHVWQDGASVIQGTHNAARKIMDCACYLKDAASTITNQPASYVSSFVTEIINPSYWRKDSEILECFSCKNIFTLADTKHHCRACGEGFCDTCSTFSRKVPERGWGFKEVRVCKLCYYKKPDFSTVDDESVCNQVRSREVSEKFAEYGAFAASAIQGPLSYINNAFVRPEYWKPDYEIFDCCVCHVEFSVGSKKHHCRSCGEGVCSVCSNNFLPVVHRGWDNPVRVCDTCKPNLVKRDN